MRSTACILAVAVFLAGCAAPTQTGNRDSGIAAWDRSARTLWINGSESFIVPAGVSTNGMMNGDTVTVTWEQQGNQRVATRISVDRRRSEAERN